MQIRSKTEVKIKSTSDFVQSVCELFPMSFSYGSLLAMPES